MSCSNCRELQEMIELKEDLVIDQDKKISEQEDHIKMLQRIAKSVEHLDCHSVEEAIDEAIKNKFNHFVAYEKWHLEKFGEYPRLQSKDLS